MLKRKFLATDNATGTANASSSSSSTASAPLPMPAQQSAPMPPAPPIVAAAVAMTNFGVTPSIPAGMVPRNALCCSCFDVLYALQMTTRLPSRSPSNSLRARLSIGSTSNLTSSRLCSQSWWRVILPALRDPSSSSVAILPQISARVWIRHWKRASWPMVWYCIATFESLN